MRSTVFVLFAAATLAVGMSAAQAQRNPPGVNPTHYQCYSVVEKEPLFKELKVELQDQFGKSGAAVLKPVMLCAPTIKNKLVPSDRRTHYLCYTDEGPKPPGRTAQIVNQFGKEVVQVEKPTMLCVPSLKTLLKQ